MTAEPPCPITDRILRAELRRVIAEHARAVEDWIGRWNYAVKVQAAEAGADPYNEEKRMRPDAACLEKDMAGVREWCTWQWERFLFGGPK